MLLSFLCLMLASAAVPACGKSGAKDVLGDALRSLTVSQITNARVDMQEPLFPVPAYEFNVHVFRRDGPQCETH